MAGKKPQIDEKIIFVEKKYFYLYSITEFGVHGTVSLWWTWCRRNISLSQFETPGLQNKPKMDEKGKKGGNFKKSAGYPIFSNYWWYQIHFKQRVATISHKEHSWWARLKWSEFTNIYWARLPRWESNSLPWNLTNIYLWREILSGKVTTDRIGNKPAIIKSRNCKSTNMSISIDHQGTRCNFKYCFTWVSWTGCLQLTWQGIRFSLYLMS